MRARVEKWTSWYGTSLMKGTGNKDYTTKYPKLIPFWLDRIGKFNVLLFLKVTKPNTQVEYWFNLYDYSVFFWNWIIWKYILRGVHQCRKLFHLFCSYDPRFNLRSKESHQFMLKVWMLLNNIYLNCDKYCYPRTKVNIDNQIIG